MKKLFVILMLLCSLAFAKPSAYDFNIKKLDGGDVLFVQPYPAKKGWTLVTVQVANNDIYVVHVDEKQNIRFVFYWTGNDLKLVFETREA